MGQPRTVSAVSQCTKMQSITHTHVQTHTYVGTLYTHTQVTANAKAAVT